jgi:hypothetical protein
MGSSSSSVPGSGAVSHLELLATAEVLAGQRRQAGRQRGQAGWSGRGGGLADCLLASKACFQHIHCQCEGAWQQWVGWVDAASCSTAVE